MTNKEYIVSVFNDLIKRIRRKAVYCCDSDMDIGKAQFCFYMIKFSKNKEVRRKVEFMEKLLSQLLSFEDANTPTSSSDDRNVFVDISQRLPADLLIGGKQLFEIIYLVHQGIDQEVARVQHLKNEFEGNNSQSVVQRIPATADSQDIKQELQDKLSEEQYPCVRLQQVYTNAVLRVVPDFKSEVLVAEGISFFEFVNTCRYFGCYNMPDEAEEAQW